MCKKKHGQPRIWHYLWFRHLLPQEFRETSEMPKYFSRQTKFIQSLKLPPGELKNTWVQGGNTTSTKQSCRWNPLVPDSSHVHHFNVKPLQIVPHWHLWTRAFTEKWEAQFIEGYIDTQSICSLLLCLWACLPPTSPKPLAFDLKQSSWNHSNSPLLLRTGQMSVCYSEWGKKKAFNKADLIFLLQTAK